MQEAIQSATEIIYDANLFVYYCFNCKIKIKGNYITVKHLFFTDKIIGFTAKLLSQGKKILTTQNAILEIERKTIAEIVEEMTEDATFRKFIKAQSSKVPSTIKYFISRKVEEKFKEMKQRNWLTIQSYACNAAAVQIIKGVYDDLQSKNDPRIAWLVNKNKRRGINSHYPSNVDMELIDYSKTKQAPLISNDRDITFFVTELIGASCCHSITALSDLDY